MALSIDTLINIQPDTMTVKNLSMNEEFIIDKQIDKNIISMMDIFKPITILSLPDNMPFLTPDKYSEYEIKKFLI
jgi:hypothetical protein